MSTWKRTTIRHLLIKKFLISQKQYKLTVTGNSMYPVVNEGNRVIFDVRPDIQIRPGDIVLFRSKRMPFVTHRVIAVSRINSHNQYLLKGDNRKTPDGWVHKSEIYGKAIKIEKKYRSINLTNWFWKLIGSCIVFIPLTHDILSMLQLIHKKFPYVR